MSDLQAAASLSWRSRLGGRLDPVWMALALSGLAGVVAAPVFTLWAAGFVADAAVGLLPFFTLSVAVTAWLQASGADSLIARVFVGRVPVMILLAALMGALSPFCSCGVIPIIAALLAVGVPLPAMMAFWLASPLMDPSMFAITVGTLGTTFALGKTAAAIGIGLLGGFGTLPFMRLPAFVSPLRQAAGGCCGGARTRATKAVAWRFWRQPERVGAFMASARGNALFLGKWMLAAFAVESLMVHWLPAESVVRFLGGDDVGSVALAALIGIPAYLNGYAALPLVGGLIDRGMAPGVGMAFLLAGGVTSIPAAMAVFAIARPPVFAAYLGFSVVGATAAGWLFGFIA